jgi:hypothetical protein
MSAACLCNRYAGAPEFENDGLGAGFKILSIADRIIVCEIEPNRSEESQNCTNFNAAYFV